MAKRSVLEPALVGRIRARAAVRRSATAGSRATPGKAVDSAGLWAWLLAMPEVDDEDLVRARDLPREV